MHLRIGTKNDKPKNKKKSAIPCNIQNIGIKKKNTTIESETDVYQK